jgi:hypothetical protein
VVSLTSVGSMYPVVASWCSRRYEQLLLLPGIQEGTSNVSGVVSLTSVGSMYPVVASWCSRRYEQLLLLPGVQEGTSNVSGVVSLTSVGSMYPVVPYCFSTRVSATFMASYLVPIWFQWFLIWLLVVPIWFYFRFLFGSYLVLFLVVHTGFISFSFFYVYPRLVGASCPSSVETHFCFFCTFHTLLPYSNKLRGSLNLMFIPRRLL